MAGARDFASAIRAVEITRFPGFRGGDCTAGSRRKTKSPGGKKAVAQVIAARDRSAVEQVVSALTAGAVVVLPTDTVYGVAASLSQPESVARIFEVKRRPRDKPLPVLINGLAEAEQLGIFEDEARRLAAEGWPGALTLIVVSRQDLSILGGDGMSVGLRVPDHSFLLEVLSRTGPLAATSANVSGEQTRFSVEDIRAELGESVDLYVDDGPHGEEPSAVISLVGYPKRLR